MFWPIKNSGEVLSKLKLQLNKANTSGTEAPFFNLHLSISNGFVSSKIYEFIINVMTLILI